MIGYIENKQAECVIRKAQCATGQSVFVISLEWNAQLWHLTSISWRAWVSTLLQTEYVICWDQDAPLPQFRPCYFCRGCSIPTRFWNLSAYLGWSFISQSLLLRTTKSNLPSVSISGVMNGLSVRRETPTFIQMFNSDTAAESQWPFLRSDFLIPLVRLEPFTVDAFSAWSDFPGCRYRYKSLTIHLPVLAYPYINKLLGASCKSEDKWNRSANYLWQKPGGVSIRRDQASLRWTCHLNDGYSSARLSFQIDNQRKSAGSLAGGSVKTVITGRCCCCRYISDRVERDRARVLDKMTAL